ncbi:MAG: heme transporter CcmB [Oscillospiraceae bacterium]|nr:heme transporter CcmB [Oscillospiraceae bacterium]
MKKVLNAALLICFLITILVPLTGVHIHKLASTLFLLLSIVHTVVYRRKLGVKRYLLLALVITSFATGIAGMILDQYPLVLILHRLLSIAVVFFMAIHIFVYHKRLRSKSV